MKTVEVSEIVDSARYLGLPLRITLLTICIMLVDGYDLQTMSFVAPELVTQWGISRSALAPVLSASLLGMALRSVLLGRLADRAGRKNAYVTSILQSFLYTVGANSYPTYVRAAGVGCAQTVSRIGGVL